MTSAAWAAVIAAVVAAAGIIGVLMRISYQLGALVTEFRQYRVSNDAALVLMRVRLDRLEDRRRRGPG